MPCDVRRIGEIAILSHGPLFMVLVVKWKGPSHRLILAQVKVCALDLKNP